eukprot:1150359-Pelagomonas_calceolata.AAC.3
MHRAWRGAAAHKGSEAVDTSGTESNRNDTVKRRAAATGEPGKGNTREAESGAAAHKKSRGE